MWKREGEPAAVPSAPARSEPLVQSRNLQESPGRAVLGPGLELHGDLKGTEDTTIEGRLEGQVSLPENTVTVGPKGRLQAQVHARVVIVEGEVEGRIEASEVVQLRKTARVRGDLVAPRVVLEDGCRFQGSIDMESKRSPASPRERPVPVPQAASPPEGS